jgi:hypothetical protein
MIDGLKVHQVVSLLETFTGWDTNNKYVIKNSLGQQVYYAMEGIQQSIDRRIHL